MTNSKMMKLVTGSLEAILAIPILGGTIVLGFGYVPLVIMGILHVITLFLSNKDGKLSVGSIFGLLASLLGWIPLLGWILHLITAIILVFDGLLQSSKVKINNEVY